TRKGSFEELAQKVGATIYAPSIPSPPFTLCNLVGYNPIWHNGTNKLYTGCPDVNVGIRTDEPRSALDVRGTTFTARLAVGVPPDEIEGRIHLRSYTSSPAAKLLTIENLDRKLLTLDNSGLLRAREIKIDTETWPDYVFEKNYSLMPLKEVEKFINQ